MKGKRFSALIGAGILLIGGTVWYWGRPTPAVAPGNLHNYREATRHADVSEGVSHVVYLDQGWDPRDSADFYTRTQGSRLLPYSFFLALEQSGSGALFRDPANLRRFGYLTQRPNSLNPHGLPVGFARDPHGGGERVDWLGLTCSACHTTELHHKDAAYRIDGGPAMVDLQAFLAELTAALTATRDDAAKFERFAAGVRKADPGAGSDAELREQLHQLCEAREAYEAANRTVHPHGPARLDAFGRIVNTLLTSAVGVSDPDQAKPPDAPVSFPFLWDAPHHDFVQWNAVARNKVLGSDELGGLARNVGEVLGVFGEVSVSPPNTATIFTGYDSSARIPDLVHLESLLRKLKSPRWPEDFPPVDEPKRAAGEKLFAKYCSRCHADIDRNDPVRSITAVRTPIKEVGTDPRMATNFADRVGKTGRLEGRRMFFVSGERFGAEARADDILVHVVVGAILGSPWKDHERPRFAELRQADGDRDDLLMYKSRPLNGIWATAPYLHNGSVPTLYHLLLPAEQRPATFHVGSRRFDPIHVGFVTDPTPGAFQFRVRDEAGNPIPGNSNAGHEYGGGKLRSAGGGDGLPPLTESQRRELVEYLKSL